MSSKNKTSAMKEGATPALVPKLRFPEFQGSEAWRFTTLDAVCEILNNRRRPITGNERTPGPYPYYGASGIVDYVGDFIFDERLLLVGEDGAKWGAFEKTAFIADGKYWVNNHAHVLKPFSANDTLLENYLAMQDLSPFVTGAAPPKLTLGKLKGIPVPLPPKPAEQQKIAACLSSVDELMAAQARKLDALKTHKKGLMQQLFPREGESQPRLRFPEFRDAPEWEVKNLEELCKIQRGKFSHRPRNDPPFFGGKYPFIQTGDVVKSNGGTVQASQTLNEQGLSVSKLFRPPIVLITIAANIGDTGLLDREACFTDSVAGLIPKEGVSPVFLELAVRGKKEYLNKIAPAAAQKNINKEILSVLPILIPEFKEQQRIADCLTSLDDLITAATQKLDTLKTHKKGLMQQLFPSAQAAEA